MYLWKKLVGLCGLLILTACGFHLKGTGNVQYELPYSSWHVENGQVMQNALESALIYQSSHVSLTENAEAVLKVIQINHRQDIQSYNNNGGVSEYLLWVRVYAQVFYQGEPVGKPIQVYAQRVLTHNHSDLLGHQQEKQSVWQDIYQDAAKQMVQKLKTKRTAFPHASPEKNI